VICLAYATAGRTRILAGASRGSAWLPADGSVTPWSSSPSPGLFPATWPRPDHEVTPKPPLTGSGCRENSYGGFGGGHPHFHPRAAPPVTRGLRDRLAQCSRCLGPSGHPVRAGVLRWIGVRASNPVCPPCCSRCCSGAVANTADGFTESRRVLTHSLVRKGRGGRTDVPFVLVSGWSGQSPPRTPPEPV
jgi:hypothetical protein